MKWILAGMAIAGCASAQAFDQQLHHWDLSQQEIRVDYTSFSRYEEVGKPAIYKLRGTPRLPVHIISDRDGIEFKATKSVTLQLAKRPDGHMYIQEATAEGNVWVNKTQVGEKSSQTTEMTGTGAHYVAREQHDATLTVAGPVKITNLSPEVGRTLVATGARAEAELDPEPAPTARASGFRSMTLEENVAIDVQQVRIEKTAAGHYRATGDRLVADYTKTPVTLTLTGHLKLTGKAEDDYEVNGAEILEITLNDAGEMTGSTLSTSSETPITTKIKMPTKPKSQPKKTPGAND